MSVLDLHPGNGTGGCAARLQVDRGADRQDDTAAEKAGAGGREQVPAEEQGLRHQASEETGEALT